ncbi:citrate lyase acyl carrier protein [Petroclostridium sp. X23]|uniref:citrate lyase acyl carrier protein n=1 Tax=Petroclostridium sp. X23 TaxID=3045146 RepID=UPI0024AD0E4F|nr:citrate lyase acyl carrier protein [Petroclostridium sp. X23]WHH59089.1 citrate lyase acyl carrier protein [Petroclostridium sp. X23]
MNIKIKAVSGTLESSDIMIWVEPYDSGIEIELNSTVEKQFGRQIRRIILETLRRLNVDAAKIIAVDKGALDCTIEARVKTAVYRACEVESYSWEA